MKRSKVRKNTMQSLDARRQILTIHLLTLSNKTILRVKAHRTLVALKDNLKVMTRMIFRI